MTRVACNLLLAGLGTAICLGGWALTMAGIAGRELARDVTRGNEL